MTFVREYTQPEPTRAEVDARRGPLLVEFGTNWCGYCQGIQAWLGAEMVRHPEIEHLKVEDGPGRPLGRSFHVKLWPTLVAMRNGQVLLQVSRPDEAAIRQAVQALSG